MITRKITPRELWSRQRIGTGDVNYDWWEEKRAIIEEYSQVSQSCIFTVDVFKERYDFASGNFASLFGYHPDRIKTIRKQGDMLEDRIHPDDRKRLAEYQIEHARFIYSLPPEQRNDYQQIFQFRILDARRQYVNVVSRHQVIAKDKNGKAWIIMGTMELSVDPVPAGKIRRTVIHRKTGEIVKPAFSSAENRLTRREKEILLLIRQGLLSKEIACKLDLSIYTISNHRKNILAKLNAGNAIEAINRAEDSGILY